LLMMLLGLRKLGNICGHKMFLIKIRNIFLCPGLKICVSNKCCARGQTEKHLCRQQCVFVCPGLYARLRSDLVPEHGAGERFLMGTNVNTPFFQVPTPEFGHGARSRPCTWALNCALISCVHTFFVSSPALVPGN